MDVPLGALQGSDPIVIRALHGRDLQGAVFAGSRVPDHRFRLSHADARLRRRDAQSMPFQITFYGVQMLARKVAEAISLDGSTID
jgi:hypothetical protein